MARKWIQSADVAVDDETGELLVRVAGSIEPKRAKIDCASDAAAGNVVVAAAAGKSIHVLSVVLMAGGGVEATFHSGPADSDEALTGPMPLADSSGFSCGAAASPALAWLATAVGEALTLKLSDAVQVSGFLVYCEVES